MNTNREVLAQAGIALAEIAQSLNTKGCKCDSCGLNKLEDFQQSKAAQELEAMARKLEAFANNAELREWLDSRAVPRVRWAEGQGDETARLWLLFRALVNGWPLENLRDATYDPEVAEWQVDDLNRVAVGADKETTLGKLQLLGWSRKESLAWVA